MLSLFLGAGLIRHLKHHYLLAHSCSILFSRIHLLTLRAAGIVLFEDIDSFGFPFSFTLAVVAWIRIRRQVRYRHVLYLVRLHNVLHPLGDACVEFDCLSSLGRKRQGFIWTFIFLSVWLHKGRFFTTVLSLSLISVYLKRIIHCLGLHPDDVALHFYHVLNFASGRLDVQTFILFQLL